MEERWILHCDCNSFFASVELLEHPELFNTPIVRNGKEATVGYQPEVWVKWE